MIDFLPQTPRLHCVFISHPDAVAGLVEEWVWTSNYCTVRIFDDEKRWSGLPTCECKYREALIQLKKLERCTFPFSLKQGFNRATTSDMRSSTSTLFYLQDSDWGKLLEYFFIETPIVQVFFIETPTVRVFFIETPTNRVFFMETPKWGVFFRDTLYWLLADQMWSN